MTLSASFFLLICNLGIFVKMAILLILTVFYSVLFTFFFFVPMIRLFGPGERETQRPTKIESLTDTPSL